MTGSMSGHLTENDVAFITEQFKKYDTSNDGKLNVHELRDIMCAFGLKLEDKVVVEMFNEFDKDGSKTLCLQEFIAIFGRMPRTDIKVANVERIFKTIDLDDSGLVTPEEITEVLTNQGISLRKGELEDMMKKIDTDANGKLTVAEFKSLWAKLC